MNYEAHNPSPSETFKVSIRPGRKNRSYRDIRVGLEEILGGNPRDSIEEFLADGGSYSGLARSLGVSVTSVRWAIHGIPNQGLHASAYERRKQIVAQALELGLFEYLAKESEKQTRVVALSNLVEPRLEKSAIAKEIGVTPTAVGSLEKRALARLSELKSHVLPPPKQKTKKMVKVEEVKGRPIEDLIFFEEQKDTSQEKKAKSLGISKNAYRDWLEACGYESSERFDEKGMTDAMKDFEIAWARPREEFPELLKRLNSEYSLRQIAEMSGFHYATLRGWYDIWNVAVTPAGKSRKRRWDHDKFKLLVEDMNSL